jgi:hypothetical protein
MFSFLFRNTKRSPEETEQRERLAALVAATNERAALANDLYTKLGIVVEEARRAQDEAAHAVLRGHEEEYEIAVAKVNDLTARASVLIRHADSAEVELIWLLPTVTPEYEETSQ